MITSTDAAEIIFRDCAPFGIRRYFEDNIPSIEGNLTDERIVIIAKDLIPSKYWESCFIEVNFDIPDIDGCKNGIRLKELERISKSLFKSVTDIFDGTRYVYEYESIGIERDSAKCSHFLNVRILFKTINTL